MSHNVVDGLTLASRINRLFDVFRRRQEPEQSVETVARSVSNLIDRYVSADDISKLRSEPTLAVDPDVLVGLARHFGVPVEYLTAPNQRGHDLDTQLQLLAAARDAGVKHLALRGGVEHDAVDQLVDVIKRVPPEDV